MSSASETSLDLKFDKTRQDNDKHEVTLSEGKSRRPGNWRFQNNDYTLSRIWEKDESGSTVSDDVSSESSIEGHPNIVTVNRNVFSVHDPQLGPGAYFDFEQFLQANYLQAYQIFEGDARGRNHVVDTFNYNPQNAWHNMYLHQQQAKHQNVYSFFNLANPANASNAGHHHPFNADQFN